MSLFTSTCLTVSSKDESLCGARMAHHTLFENRWPGAGKAREHGGGESNKCYKNQNGVLGLLKFKNCWSRLFLRLARSIFSREVQMVAYSRTMPTSFWQHEGTIRSATVLCLQPQCALKPPSAGLIFRHLHQTTASKMYNPHTDKAGRSEGKEAP